VYSPVGFRGKEGKNPGTTLLVRKLWMPLMKCFFLEYFFRKLIFGQQMVYLHKKCF